MGDPDQALAQAASKLEDVWQWLRTVDRRRSFAQAIEGAVLKVIEAEPRLRPFMQAEAARRWKGKEIKRRGRK